MRHRLDLLQRYFPKVQRPIIQMSVDLVSLFSPLSFAHILNFSVGIFSYRGSE
ncbi:hypothetical protein BJY52DRAFT_1417854 [Lactarius psammicola]|nr:hypothetical protein BJY52DRAFT_1417854 [Lactarius psammicola]